MGVNDHEDYSENASRAYFKERITWSSSISACLSSACVLTRINSLAEWARIKRTVRAEIHQGHVSTAFCHLANIAYLVGRSCPPADIAAALHDQPLLAESFDRLARHVQANEVDLDQTPLVLGPMLTLDASQERFTGDMSESANARLTRIYRPPSSLPDVV